MKATILFTLLSMCLLAEQKAIYKKEIVKHPEGNYEISTPYINGKKHGIEIISFGNGAHIDIPYLNGKKHGVMISHHSDGSVSRISTWKNGTRYGVMTRFHESGYIAVISRIGKEGEVIETRTYEDYEGKVKSGIPPNPLKKMRRQIYEDRNHNIEITYWRTGKPKWVTIRDEGKVIYSGNYKVEYPGCTAEGLRIEGVGKNWSELKIGEQ